LTAHAASSVAGPTRRAIIAGYGVVGRAIADHLEIQNVPFTIIELNARTVETQQGLGRSVVFGDIGNPEVLEHAGIREVDAVLLTIPDDDAVMRACQMIRVLAPHVFIAARTTYLSTAFQASAAGADDVTISEVATAEAMVKRVLSRLKKL
jgi:voltage-gated potassium channel Kch